MLHHQRCVNTWAGSSVGSLHVQPQEAINACCSAGLAATPRYSGSVSHKYGSRPCNSAAIPCPKPDSPQRSTVSSIERQAAHGTAAVPLQQEDSSCRSHASNAHSSAQAYTPAAANAQSAPLTTALAVGACNNKNQASHRVHGLRAAASTASRHPALPSVQNEFKLATQQVILLAQAGRSLQFCRRTDEKQAPSAAHLPLLDTA